MQHQAHKFHLREEQTTLLAREAAQNEIAYFPITTFMAGGSTESFRGTRSTIFRHSGLLARQILSDFARDRCQNCLRRTMLEETPPPYSYPGQLYVPNRTNV